MQTMAKINFVQRVASDACARTPATLEVTAMIPSLIPWPVIFVCFFEAPSLRH
jgi:hypothetical protein